MSFNKFIVQELHKLVIERDTKINMLEQKLVRVSEILNLYDNFTYNPDKCVCCNEPLLSYYVERLIFVCLNCEVFKDHNCPDSNILCQNNESLYR